MSQIWCRAQLIVVGRKPRSVDGGLRRILEVWRFGEALSHQLHGPAELTARAVQQSSRFVQVAGLKEKKRELYAALRPLERVAHVVCATTGELHQHALTPSGQLRVHDWNFHH